MEYNAISTVAFNSCSGGTLGRPLVAYMALSSASSSPSTASTTARIRRIGWSAGTRSSVLNVVNIANWGSGEPRIPHSFRPSPSTGVFQHPVRPTRRVPGCAWHTGRDVAEVEQCDLLRVADFRIHATAFRSCHGGFVSFRKPDGRR